MGLSSSKSPSSPLSQTLHPLVHWQRRQSMYLAACRPLGAAIRADLVSPSPTSTSTLRGVVLKYNEPPEARKPVKSWRMYVFKGKEQVGESTFRLSRTEEPRADSVILPSRRPVPRQSSISLPPRTRSDCQFCRSSLLHLGSDLPQLAGRRHPHRPSLYLKAARRPPVPSSGGTQRIWGYQIVDQVRFLSLCRPRASELTFSPGSPDPTLSTSIRPTVPW